MLKKKYWVIVILGLAIFLSPPFVNGETMSTSNYSIEKQKLDIQPFRQPTPKPIAKQPESNIVHSGKNFTVFADKASYISFTTSHNIVNFGTPTATNPVIRLLHLGISSTDSYQILTAQDHSLLDDKNIIPDTTCDSGSCTEITGAEWVNTLTYGFGYHTSDMIDNTYKQFPDLSKKERLETIPQGNITYKINISGSQPQGSYNNTITYLATPVF